MDDQKFTSKNELHIYFDSANGTKKQILKNPKSNSETIITHATALNASLAGSLAGKWYTQEGIQTETAITKISKIETYEESKVQTTNKIFEDVS